MDINKIEESVFEIANDFLSHIPEDYSADLQESGLIDSLAVMNILSSIEDEFDIEVDIKDITKENFKSIEAIAEMVSKYLD